MNQNNKNMNINPDFMGGLIGGLSSALICHPLDITKTRLNLQMSVKNMKIYNGSFDVFKKMFFEEKLKGFYKGLNISLISVPVFNSIFFTLYNMIQTKMKNKFQNTNVHYISLMSSLSAGFITDIATNPLWVVRIRLQSQHLHNKKQKIYNGVLDAFKKIYRNEGIMGFYKGLTASLMGLSHVAVYFPIYEKMKQIRQESKMSKTLNSTDIFFCAIFTKIIACCTTYPHVVIRARLMDFQKNQIVQDSNRLQNAVRQIYQKEGLKGFYSGLKIDIFRVLPQNAIIFVCYEYVKKQLAYIQNVH